MTKIKIIIYDFDGVMTDNKAYVDENGKETVQINRSDGLGIELLKKLGLEQMIMSTEKNKVVKARAKKLEIPVIQGVNNKLETLIKFCKKRNVLKRSVAFLGNDINDKEAMLNSGLSFCPLDAHSEIKNISTHILNAKGGEGVVREMFDFVKKNENLFKI
tara:strand:- start:36 stop:515 length:480 start_codon:yes stop_codon:yes gene_type:complete